MLIKVSAYNGGTLTDEVEGNTVGSLTREQQSIIIGSLLGDGSMRCKTNALLEINHSIAQKVYVDWKYEKLKTLVQAPPRVRKGNGSRIAYRFTTLSLPELTVFYKQFYQERRKVVPENLILTPLSLAVWFMDDGCKSYRALYLNTQQFDIKSQQRLIELLSEQWNLVASLNKGKKYYRLRLSVSSVASFKQIIQFYLLPEFEYKFP